MFHSFSRFLILKNSWDARECKQPRSTQTRWHHSSATTLYQLFTHFCGLGDLAIPYFASIFISMEASCSFSKMERCNVVCVSSNHYQATKGDAYDWLYSFSVRGWVFYQFGSGLIDVPVFLFGLLLIVVFSPWRIPTLIGKLSQTTKYVWSSKVWTNFFARKLSGKDVVSFSSKLPKEL